MKTFNDERPRDMITLEMRIQEDVRHVLRSMFISSEDKKKLLEDSLEVAISSHNITACIEKYAHEAIDSSVKEYFSYGEGGKALRKAVDVALTEVLGKLFDRP